MHMGVFIQIGPRLRIFVDFFVVLLLWGPEVQEASKKLPRGRLSTLFICGRAEPRGPVKNNDFVMLAEALVC